MNKPVISSKVLEKDQIYVLFFEAATYSQEMLDLMRQIQDKKVAYVSLNKTYSTILKDLKRKSIKHENFFVIDTRSEKIETLDDTKVHNVCFLSSPAALTELSITISHVLKTNHFDYIIFDSLSTLLIYDKETRGGIVKFTTTLMNKIKGYNIKAIFTAIEDHRNSFLVEEACAFSDVVEEYNKISMSFIK